MHIRGYGKEAKKKRKRVSGCLILFIYSSFPPPFGRPENPFLFCLVSSMMF